MWKSNYGKEEKIEMIDLLIDWVAITRENADGTIERCSPSELVGKDLEVSVRDYSFQDIKNEFERSHS